MRVADLFQHRLAAIVASLVAILLSFLLGGPTAGVGMALGIGASAFGLVGWWLVIQLITGEKVRSDGGSGGKGAFWVLLVFLIKLPLFFALAFHARKIGGMAVPCFLGGLSLVYFSLVGWALTKKVETP